MIQVDVPIFKVGNWNGIEWTMAHLASWVDYFEQYELPMGYFPYVWDENDRIIGLAKALRLEGDTLHCDIEFNEYQAGRQLFIYPVVYEHSGVSPHTYGAIHCLRASDHSASVFGFPPVNVEERPS